MTSSHQSSINQKRKQYQKPRLMELGDLRTQTLGGSPGTGDSGSSGTRKSATGIPTAQPIGIHRPDGSILLPDGSILMPDGTIITQ
jgi:hypothetical protein